MVYLFPVLLLDAHVHIYHYQVNILVHGKVAYDSIAEGLIAMCVS